MTDNIVDKDGNVEFQGLVETQVEVQGSVKGDKILFHFSEEVYSSC